jgi:hypothetical protein
VFALSDAAAVIIAAAAAVIGTMIAVVIMARKGRNVHVSIDVEHRDNDEGESRDR